MECHSGIESKVARRKEIIRGRVDQIKDPQHWVFEKKPWKTMADLTGAPDFRRSRNVTWEEQMRLHGDGRSHPGAQYAFVDLRFNKG